MDIQHPWTKYEVARLRNEERLLRAREAMRALEVREAEPAEKAPKDVRRLGSFWRARPHKARASAAEPRSEST